MALRRYLMIPLTSSNKYRNNGMGIEVPIPTAYLTPSLKYFWFCSQLWPCHSVWPRKALPVFIPGVFFVIPVRSELSVESTP